MNYRKGRILVQAKMDNCGNIYARPVCNKYAKKFAEIVKEFTGYFDLDAFFQEGFSAHEFIEHTLPSRYKTDLDQGWEVRFLMDPRIVGHWYGYDAHYAQL